MAHPTEEPSFSPLDLSSLLVGSFSEASDSHNPTNVTVRSAGWGMGREKLVA